MSAAVTRRGVIGWDVGGAHVKAALLERGEVHDVAQWPCPLWQGLQHLDTDLHAARRRWPQLAECRHAVTMTGEMVDLFAHREDGVAQIAARLAGLLPQPRFFAADLGWCDAASAAAAWKHIASANWLATARHVASVLETEAGVLIDVGSTTTDLIAFRAGRVLTRSRSDVQRLENNELFYQGVVRTPLFALAPRISWRGSTFNVMNEFFATTADVYRLTGELDPAHDQHPSADNAAKDLPATRARLARMIGLDARDASDAEWLDFAHAWRALQGAALRDQLHRVILAHGLAESAVLVSAGCGAFLVAELAPKQRCLAYARDVCAFAVQASPDAPAWAQVCAPSVAVAALHAKEFG